MAEGQDPIVIDVEFEGGQQAASGLASVTQGLGQMDQAADAAAQSTAQATASWSQMAQGGTQLAQRIQGVAGATQGLVSALGSRDRTAGLVASLAGSVAQFAAMGAMLGPAGAVAGGIAGLAIGVAGLASANREARPEIEATTESIREEGEVASTAADRMRDFLDSISSSSRTEAVAGLSATITELTDEMYRLRDAGDGLGAEVIAERLRTLSRFAESDRANIAEEVATTDAPRRGGARGPVDLMQSRQGGADPMRSVGDEQLNHTAELEAARLALIEDTLAKEARMRDEAVEEARKRADEELAIWEHQAEEMARLGEEQEAERQANDERMLEQREASFGELTGMLGDVTMSMGKALGSIATGEKTAEEAFKGLAGAFLQMLSEYATLKAATEFADAAASFARYDYGGGAAHIGAGVAFTAVAVATGIGAAVVSAPPSAPARPETNAQGTGGGRGGDVIINWNAPVITAGTRAELGREINTLSSEAGSL